MIAGDKNTPSEVVETEQADRLSWVRPEVRTLTTGDAELTSTARSDGGASFS